MAASDADRLPTAGPDGETYDRYRAVATGDDEVIIYDSEGEAAWIQATNVVALEDWR